MFLISEFIDMGSWNRFIWTTSYEIYNRYKRLRYVKSIVYFRPIKRYSDMPKNLSYYLDHKSLVDFSEYIIKGMIYSEQCTYKFQPVQIYPRLVELGVGLELSNPFEFALWVIKHKNLQKLVLEKSSNIIEHIHSLDSLGHSIKELEVQNIAADQAQANGTVSVDLNLFNIPKVILRFYHVCIMRDSLHGTYLPTFTNCNNVTHIELNGKRMILDFWEFKNLTTLKLGASQECTILNLPETVRHIEMNYVKCSPFEIQTCLETIKLCTSEITHSVMDIDARVVELGLDSDKYDNIRWNYTSIEQLVCYSHHNILANLSLMISLNHLYLNIDRTYPTHNDVIQYPQNMKLFEINCNAYELSEVQFPKYVDTCKLYVNGQTFNRECKKSLKDLYCRKLVIANPFTGDNFFSYLHRPYEEIVFEKPISNLRFIKKIHHYQKLYPKCKLTYTTIRKYHFDV